MKRLSFLLPILSLGLVLHFFSGCASEDKKSDTPEGLFAMAQEFEKDERYEEAIKRYTEVKNRFPYSAKAIEAELAVADVYYKQESFAESQINYITFRELHPKHPRIDYVIFRTAMSYYNQLPETIDRDLTLANDAINYFSELIVKFPNSEFVKEANEKKVDCYNKLAEKEAYVGEFYFKRKHFESALTRYENIIKRYAQTSTYPLALSQASICAKKVGNTSKYRQYMSVLETQFPKSDELEDARKATR